MDLTVQVPSTPKRPKRPSETDSPRRRKEPFSLALRGLRNDRKETVQDIRRIVTKKLQLTFQMDEWQVHLIHKIRMRYDSILLAGTGYGKSLIFQGLAVMDPHATVIVVSPLKALERDQVAEAEKKGLRAAMINENTACSKLWGRHDTNPIRAFNKYGTIITPDQYTQELAVGTPVKAEFRLVKFGFPGRPNHAFVAYLTEIRVVEPFGTPASPYPSGDPIIVRPPVVIPIPPTTPRRPSSRPRTVPLANTPSKAYLSPPATPMGTSAIPQVLRLDSPTPRKVIAKRDAQATRRTPTPENQKPDLKRRYLSPDSNLEEDYNHHAHPSFKKPRTASHASRHR
ncbi:hypothetical protein CVT24_002161 [Panaeolus cyanescens]|uniref:DEAD/DEAH-box helicase domain-containing protein n=1 Tax=Panaeolus cyanescens TaxID=181874 RepID=A0A409YHT5_9AGAR|nr:hypothetical protein CVT24_002161 [Panaeolus cyanescens]